MYRTALMAALSLGITSAYNPAMAESSSCQASLSRMTLHIESAASRSGRGDACGTADAIELALNAAGDAQHLCVAEGKQMAARYIAVLPGQLAQAVSACGR